ncbi:hypothetical protein FIU85_17050 [Roseovarius sp. THAF8]|uniref:hypothetical protein n=1 Tax=Roseovarius sp. THAF8 TaxID=2587846 RepID=UPI00126816EF|nr:hypothetical protein [Roseovarius sp. THAF8]QFT99024.1 hypothetical protein FIU85_17050 [Roseovarius sp. THAF8]
MIRGLCGAILAGWLCAGAATAQAVFDETVALWLSGDDSGSLPRLAELAQEGHADARILLARIETMDRGPSPYRMGLAPQERRALFRDMSDKSRFGRSWLAVEAKRGNRLAEMFLRSRKPFLQLQTHFALWQAGERQATEYPTRIAALYGSRTMREKLLASRTILPEMRPYLAFLADIPEPQADGMAALRHMIGLGEQVISADDPETLGMAQFLALGFGFGDVSARNRWRQPVEEWVLRDLSTRPIADLCRTACPKETGACAVTLFALTGGFYGVTRLDSPYEKVITQELFLNSPRARIMTLRRAALARDEPNQKYLSDRPGISRLSSCAAVLVLRERANYDALH